MAKPEIKKKGIELTFEQKQTLASDEINAILNKYDLALDFRLEKKIYFVDVAKKTKTNDEEKKPGE